MRNIWHLGEAWWAMAGVPPFLTSLALSVVHLGDPLFPLLCAIDLSFLRAARALRGLMSSCSSDKTECHPGTALWPGGCCCAWDQGTTCHSHCIFHFEVTDAHYHEDTMQAGSVAQLVEGLPSKQEALSLIPLHCKKQTWCDASIVPALRRRQDIYTTYSVWGQPGLKPNRKY